MLWLIEDEVWLRLPSAARSTDYVFRLQERRQSKGAEY